MILQYIGNSLRNSLCLSTLNLYIQNFCYFTLNLCITNLKAFWVWWKVSVLGGHWWLRRGILLLWRTWWNGSYCWSCSSINITISTTIIGSNNTGMIWDRCYCLWHLTINVSYSFYLCKKYSKKNLQCTKLLQQFQFKQCLTLKLISILLS